jgi:hypothetical protein
MNVNTYSFKARALVGVAFGLAIVGAGAGVLTQKPSAFTAAPSGKVTPWAAMKTAAAKTGGKPFQAVFEFEDGRWQYGVLVLRGGKISEVEINATTGAVGDVEGITPAGEAKEAKSELEAAIKAGGK